MNNWMTQLFNTGRRQPFLRMFGKRRNNRGMMWGSLLSLGISAAAYGLTRNRNRNMMGPLQGVMNNVGMGKTTRNLNTDGLTEFSKELLPNKNPNNNR